MLSRDAEAGISVRELDSIAIVGAGRLGTALAAALGAAGLDVRGPLGRGADVTGEEVVLLCVPDGEIEGAAAARRWRRTRRSRCTP
jgi:glycerol-3-phosphate dehydrogenase